MHNEGFSRGKPQARLWPQLRAEETDPPQSLQVCFYDVPSRKPISQEQFHGFGPSHKQSCEFSFLHLLRAMLGAEKEPRVWP